MTAHDSADDVAEFERSWLADARRGVADILPAVGLALAVVVIWEVAVQLFKVPVFVIPAPSGIVFALIEQRAALAAASKATAVEVLFGFVLAAVVGIAVALVIVRFERFGKAL